MITACNSNNSQEVIQRITRDGVEIEKGVILTAPYLEQHKESLEELFSLFTAYPDIFLDIIKPADSNFELFFYQRITLRALMRYKDVYVTAPRAFSKSFITVLALILQCIFMPGTKRFICAPGKGQSVQIAREKIIEIYQRWPLIRREIVGGDISDTPGNFSKDYLTLKFRNGSQFDVVAPLDSTRGGRRHGGLIDEVRDHEEQPINEIVLPLLNVSRRLPDNTVNPKEVNQQRIFMTSAGTKTSFAYDLLIDTFESSIIDPQNAFCFGCDYRVPVLHGLLDTNFINKLKMSPSYNEDSFAREYLSLWSGASEESWFNFDKLQKYREIKNPEKHAFFRANSNQFYLLSVDVGRLGDQTVCCVFRVNIIKDKYYATLVNLYVLGKAKETRTFKEQVIELKKIIAAFTPKEVVIDTNGLKTSPSNWRQLEKTPLIAENSLLRTISSRT